MTREDLEKELDISDLKYDMETAIRETINRAVNRGFSAGYQQGWDRCLENREKTCETKKAIRDTAKSCDNCRYKESFFCGECDGTLKKWQPKKQKITRKEAEEVMQTIKADCYIISTSEEKEAFDMAISALTSIMALSEDLKTFKKDIYMSEETLLGFNLAMSLFNKHFREK